MKTPYFILNQNLLQENIDSFKNALNIYWPNSQIGYSIKTNSLPWVLKYMKNQMVFAEAVSREEYELAKLCGYSSNEIIYNGPIKNIHDIEVAFKEGAIINIDSQKELKYIKEFKPQHNGNLGVRINVNPYVFDPNDIGYIDDGFRFGFSNENGDLKKVIDLLKTIYNNTPFGLHLHCNSITRSKNVYKSIANYAANIIKQYNLRPSFIDIGGGFFGGVPGKTTPEEYISTIAEQLKDVVDFSETKLIIEPGSAFIGSTVDLYTSVIDAKSTNFANIITTDGSRIHIDPLWKKKSYLYSIETTSHMPIEQKQIICGYTCMDHDRIMILENKPLLQVGDKIIYHRVGAYTVTFGGPFIRYFPDVYVNSNGSLKLIRKRMSVSDYYNIEYLEEKNDE